MALKQRIETLEKEVSLIKKAAQKQATLKLEIKAEKFKVSAR